MSSIPQIPPEVYPKSDTPTQTDRLTMIGSHLDALWPPAWRETGALRQHQPFLVRSHPDPDRPRAKGQPSWVSSWHRMPADLSALGQQTLEASACYDEYYGVNLGRADVQPSPYHRLKRTDIVVVPGLLGDFDGGWGNHHGAALQLPETLDALGAFLQGLPSPPTRIINTGGGVHTYHLFETPWVLRTPEDHAAFVDLAERFKETVEGWARERGWTHTSLFASDLTRVLRLPGTISHKYGSVITVLEDTGIRYTPDALRSWLPPRRTPPTPRTPRLAADAGQGTLDLEALAEYYNMTLTQKSEDEWCGSHPVHGSDTGTNVDINPAQQVWHCHRHTTGGDALLFLAVCEEVVSCA